MAHPQIRYCHGVEPHHLGRNSVDGDRVARREEVVLHHRIHGTGPGAIARHCPVHHREDGGMELLLHHHQVHQDLVDVLVRVMPHFLEKAAESVLDRPGRRGMTMRLHRGKVEDVPAEIDPGDFDSFGEDLVQAEQRRPEAMNRPFHFG